VRPWKLDVANLSTRVLESAKARVVGGKEGPGLHIRALTCSNLQNTGSGRLEFANPGVVCGQWVSGL